MMKYILDTNIVRYLEDKNSSYKEIITHKLSMLADTDQVCLSVLSIYEIEYGIALASAKSKEDISALKDSTKRSFCILPLTEKSAQAFGQIKAEYKRKTGISKKAIERHNIDFMLASSAIAENAILVSNDAIFKTIQQIYPQFKYENWTL